jgi:hypothetical protein
MPAMKGNAMKQALHHVCALRGAYPRRLNLRGAIHTLTLGFFLCAWATATLAQGGLFDLFPPSKGNTLLCSSAPTKCVEKSAEDLRYERILEALKKMEGGERIYSAMATPANEPASYGPSQMVIEKIIKGLQSKGGTEFTFTAKDGKSYTLTQKHLKDAHNRGKAMFDSGPDLLKEAAKYNDYKDLTMPARTSAADGFLKKSGIPEKLEAEDSTSTQWDKWWEAAVAYQKLIELVKKKLWPEYDKKETVVKDAKGNVLSKTNGSGRVPETFYAFVDQLGNIPDVTPAVTYGKRLDELLKLAFPDVKSDHRKAFNPYIRSERWEEGRWSFYNRAAYNAPDSANIPYKAFKEGLAKWFDATPEAEESHIRTNIKAAAEHKDVNKDVKILHPDADEEKIAQYFASKHNTGGFGAIKGKYATKLVEHWKKIKWNFKCGTDPRNKPTSEPEPKEAQA